MSIILQNSLQMEINKRFGVSQEPEAPAVLNDQDWNCLTYATQDYDSLAEFMYEFNLKLNLAMPPVYFNPSAQWAYIRLPKLKLKWSNGLKVSQTRIGTRDYNIINAEWSSDGMIRLPIADGSCMIKPLYNIPKTGQVSTVLIPHDNLDITKLDEDPAIKIGGQTLVCKYPITHYSISINRQGIYVNRKYRDKMVYDATTLAPEQYVIVEPKQLIIKDHKGNALTI